MPQVHMSGPSDAPSSQPAPASAASSSTAQDVHRRLVEKSEAAAAVAAAAPQRPEIAEYQGVTVKRGDPASPQKPMRTAADLQANRLAGKTQDRAEAPGDAPAGTPSELSHGRGVPTCAVADTLQRRS
jgi:hypothetical protein